eukprot:TRINITY_DN20866_c0_g2_i1.p1 TRINITY_DN20866_c0_g2~~TRINITY_DN20866_c0_g2_i1.p1  ORF type:complete len:147 (+),score=10.01 TRINITY_DN20866_c0_g2_i1:129-569(+)
MLQLDLLQSLVIVCAMNKEILEFVDIEEDLKVIGSFRITEGGAIHHVNEGDNCILNGESSDVTIQKNLQELCPIAIMSLLKVYEVTDRGKDEGTKVSLETVENHLKYLMTKGFINQNGSKLAGYTTQCGKRFIAEPLLYLKKSPRS